MFYIVVLNKFDDKTITLFYIHRDQFYTCLFKSNYFPRTWLQVSEQNTSDTVLKIHELTSNISLEFHVDVL